MIFLKKTIGEDAGVGANYKLLNAKKETKKTNVSKLFYVLTVL